MTIQRTVISVSNKAHIIDFARALETLGITMYVTSGTYQVLKQGGIQLVHHVSHLTQTPEIVDGAVKTIHHKLISGILARRENESQMNDLKRLGIDPIDMVVCNFFSFKEPTDVEDNLPAVLEQIDVGGPNMVRAAVKNLSDVVVIVNPLRYDEVIRELKTRGDVRQDLRLELAIEAFQEVVRYDQMNIKFLKKYSKTVIQSVNHGLTSTMMDKGYGSG